MIARKIRTAQVLLGLALLGLLLAAPAVAASSAENQLNERMLPFPVVNELCDGDCSNLPPIPGPNADSFDLDLDFEYGLQIMRGGLDVRLASQGNVFLLGPVRVKERFYGEAGGTLAVFGNGSIIADEIFLQTNPRGGKGGMPGDFPIFGDLPLYPPPTRIDICLLYTSPSPRDQRGSRMPSSA